MDYFCILCYPVPCLVAVVTSANTLIDRVTGTVPGHDVFRFEVGGGEEDIRGRDMWGRVMWQELQAGLEYNT